MARTDDSGRPPERRRTDDGGRLSERRRTDDGGRSPDGRRIDDTGHDPNDARSNANPDDNRSVVSGTEAHSTDETRYPDATIAVVVPAYNEAAHVGGVVDSIPRYVDRIYAVDDASVDDTWAEILARVPASCGDDTRAESTDGRLVPIRHAENQGAGAALRTGYRMALDEDVDVVVTLDADGQMDPDRMDALVDPIVSGSADYAKGDRLSDRTHRSRMPPFRRFGNWTLTLLTRVSSGYWDLTDPQNGFTAISGDALAAIDVDALPDDHDYPNDLLARLNVAGARVVDVDLPAAYGDEESTIDFGAFVTTTSRTLVRSFLWRIRRMHAPDTTVRDVASTLGILAVVTVTSAVAEEPEVDDR